IARGKLSDDSACVRVVVASRNQRRACWRAERGGVKHVVTESTVREPLKVRRLNRPTECTAGSEPNVIRQDQKDVRSPHGCFDALRKIRRRIGHRATDFTLKGWLRLG